MERNPFLEKGDYELNEDLSNRIKSDIRQEKVSNYRDEAKNSMEDKIKEEYNSLKSDIKDKMYATARQFNIRGETMLQAAKELAEDTDRPLEEVIDVLERNVNNPDFDPNQPVHAWKKSAIREINKSVQNKVLRKNSQYDGMLSSYDNKNSGEEVELVNSYKNLQEMNFRKDELGDTKEFKKLKSDNLVRQMGFLKRLSKGY